MGVVKVQLRSTMKGAGKRGNCERMMYRKKKEKEKRTEERPERQ